MKPHPRDSAPIPALFVLLLSGGVSLTVPLMVAALFDTILPQANTGLLAPVAAALVAATVVQGLLHLAGLRGLLREGVRIAEQRGRKAWTRLISLPLSVLQKKPAVEIATQAEASAEAGKRREEFLEATLPAGLIALPHLGLMIFWEPFLALVAAGLAIGATGATVVFRLWRRPALFRLFEQRAAREAGLTEAFHGLAKLRAAGAENWALRRWQENSSQLTALDNPLSRANAGALGVLAGTAALSCALLFAISSRTQLSLGEFLGFFAAFSAFTAALRVIAGSWPTRWDAQALEGLSSPLFQTPSDHPGLALARLSGEIDVRDLTFRYATTPVLRDFSLHVRPGEMVVISANSGAGKSTILRLLLGFEKPEGGEIRFDGHQLSELDLAKLRSRIGVVLQNPFLSQGSIFQNIAAGDDLSLDEAWHAAELAGMADEIRTLPMGMHSLVGAQGMNFPAGQRQRLALARALARRPDILLLDEPTSGLDLRSRKWIWAALEGLRLTRIIFTHDGGPRTANRILRLENGCLQQG